MFLQKALLSATVKGDPPSTGILQRSTLLSIQNMAVLFGFLFFLLISYLREELALCGSLARSLMFFFSKIMSCYNCHIISLFFPPNHLFTFFPLEFIFSIFFYIFLLKYSHTGGNCSALLVSTLNSFRGNHLCPYYNCSLHVKIYQERILFLIYQSERVRGRMVEG